MATFTRDSKTDKELTECDRERLDFIARIQGGAGHLIFIEYPSGRILAHDRDIRKVPWIKEGNERCSDLPNSVEESLIDSDLASFCPEDLYEALLSDLRKLSVSSSPRTFRFYSHKDNAYAISVTSTASDYSIIGIEIEEIDSDQVSISQPFQNCILSIDTKQCCLTALSVSLHSHEGCSTVLINLRSSRTHGSRNSPW
jgi:hypothetical protein